MTVKELVKAHEAKNPGSVFFDSSVLKRCGESLERMRVTGKGITHDAICYELVAEADCNGRMFENRYYFDAEDFTVHTFYLHTNVYTA